MFTIYIVFVDVKIVFKLLSYLINIKRCPNVQILVTSSADLHNRLDDTDDFHFSVEVWKEKHF